MDNKILYIVGAGASAEVKLPIGSGLKNKIKDYLSCDNIDEKPNDDLILEALEKHVGKNNEDINLYFNACSQISSSMQLSLSIDNYIHTHRDNKIIEFCGKLAIARSILEAEKESLLYLHKYIYFDLDSLESTWYVSFFKLLTENCTKDELPERLKSISLIIFNYDRCVEHFLYNAFKIYYDLTEDEAASFVNEIEIYHPYGVVGNLPWQNKYTAVDYGKYISSEKLLEVATQIKTFTEGIDSESSDIKAIHSSVYYSDKIIFLGFAFHPLNMELMTPTKERSNTRVVETNYFATAYDISYSDRDIINNKLKDFTSRTVRQVQLEARTTCSELFQTYWRSLSFN